jgi:hypothetical protein
MKIKKTTLKKYIEFLSDLEKENAESEYVEFNLWLPYSESQETQQEKHFLREMLSPYSYDNGKVEAIPQIAKRLTAKKALGKRLLNCEKLTICDPYFFFIPDYLTAKEYVAQFISTIPLKMLRVLNIVYNGKKRSEVIQEFKRQIPSFISLKLFVDYSLHDRVWIVNDNYAFIVGTSFGSIGNKVAFIVDLPSDDFSSFKKHLSKATKNFQA